VPGQFSIRQISVEESRGLADQARRRNVFARHSWENSFYINRIGELANATVIELSLPGLLDEVLPIARARAENIEKVAVLSSALGIQRARLQRLLAVSRHRRHGFDLGISPGFEYLRSSARAEPIPRGIAVDDVFIRRFARCGFANLVQATGLATALGKRLEQGVNWLFESRQEPALNAAIVKTAIALESLLIANDHESLRGPLAERAAFLLSDSGAMRPRIAKVVKKFYDARSGVVHGGRRRPASVSTGLLEGIDRVVVLLLLVLSANASSWSSSDEVVAYLENRKWGAAAHDCSRPFPGSHLKRAIELAEKGVTGD
jgi:hypothetical protein